MSAYIKIGDVKGASTQADHKDWIEVESVSSSIMRSIPNGAKGLERARGQTSLSDVVVHRALDKSSAKLAEACAKGDFYPEAEIHICNRVAGKEEPVFKYKLKNVVLGNYQMDASNLGDSDMPQQFSEMLSLNFTEVEWTYVVWNPETGKKEGQVVGKFNPKQ